MKSWLDVKFVTIVICFLAAISSSPANACVEIFQGGCAIEAQIREQARVNDDARQAMEAAEAAMANGQPMPSLPNRPPPPKPSSYITVWWHPDANDVWAVWNHDNLYDAGFNAYFACLSVMGDGCELATEGALSTVVIARNQTGGIVFGKDKNPEKARSILNSYCAENNQNCQMLHEFTAKMPKKGRPVAEAYFAGSAAMLPGKGQFAVGLTNEYGSKDELWLSSGLPSAKGAQVLAKNFCERTNIQRKTGYCSENDTPEFTADAGYVLIFRDASGFGDTVAGADKRELERQATNLCMQRRKSACAGGMFVDTRDRRDALINFSKLPSWPKGSRAADMPAPLALPGGGGPTGSGPGSGMSYRSQPIAGGGTWSAQAWIKGDSGVWKFYVWSVSGGTDEGTTKAAALAACQSETERECEVFSSTQDMKIALYSDDDKTIRIGRVRYAIDPVPLVKSKCKSEKTTCNIVKIIDSHAALAERIEVR